MKIHMNEFKHKLVYGVNELVDTYFSETNIKERLMNATAKIIITQNVDKLDDFMVLFTDKNGYVDTDVLMREYGKAFGADKLIIDLRDFIENEMVRDVLPNKAIAIKIDDIAKIFEDHQTY